jgi:hypothetical protein
METLRPLGRQNPAGSQRVGYVVYTLTPNMWEAPWVRHLLSALPASRHEVINLWSPPPERARVRRATILLESLLPGPLRPTRRMLRRVVRPHDGSIFVYNTWGLDPAVRAELGRLLSRFRDIAIVSVDEPGRDSRETYMRVAFGVRIGFGGEKYTGAENLLIVPLGVPKNFMPPRAPKSIGERNFSWAFLGEVKNESRQKMVSSLEAVRGEGFLHTTSAWESDDALRGSGYSDVLADTVFAPSPPANVHLECYRTYEALDCGAIPVVDTDYYKAQFGAPFPVVRPDWADAPGILTRYLDDPGALARLDSECRAWWDAVKRNYPAKIRELSEQVKRVN